MATTARFSHRSFKALAHLSLGRALKLSGEVDIDQANSSIKLWEPEVVFLQHALEQFTSLVAFQISESTVAILAQGTSWISGKRGVCGKSDGADDFSRATS